MGPNRCQKNHTASSLKSMFRSRCRPLTFQRNSRNLTYIISASRKPFVAGFKYRKDAQLVTQKGHVTALPASSQVLLTIPSAEFVLPPLKSLCLRGNGLAEWG